MPNTYKISSEGEITNSTPLGVEAVNPQTGLDGPTKPIDARNLQYNKQALYSDDLIGSVSTGEYVPKSVYRILGDDYHPEFDPEYNAQLLAASQTNAGKFVSALNQAVIGEIVGGTIEGFGYLGDIPMMIDLMEGTEQEFGNALTRVGKKLKTWAEDATPVFTDPTAPKFAPTSWEWWMKNLPSVASTVSLVIPSMAGMKAIQGVGKLTGIMKEMGQLGKFSKVFDTALGQAIMSRHMESLMESSGVYEQGLADAKNSLYSKYADQIDAEVKALPIFTPVDPETGPKPGQYTQDQYQKDLNKIKNKWESVISEEANKMAAMGAANTYGKNWVLLLQDIPQYKLLNGILKPGAKTMAKRAVEESADVAKRLGYNMPKFYASKAAKHTANLLGEGLEEQYQFIANKQSAEMIKRLGDPEYKSNLLKVLGDNYDDGEFWTNGFFGVIGAGFMQATMSGLNTKALANASKARIKEINSYSEMFNKLHADIMKADDEGDPIAKEHAVEEFVAASALRSIDLNTKDHLVNLVDALATDDENVLSSYEVDQESRTFFKGRNDIAERIKKSINNMELKYKDAKTEVAKRGVVEDKSGKNIALARQIAHSNYMLEFLNGKLDENQQKLKAIEIPGYNVATPEGEMVSEEGRKIFALRYEKFDINRRLNSIKKQLDKEDITETDKKQLEKVQARYKEKLSVIQAGMKESAKLATAVDKKLLGSESKQNGTIPQSSINEYIQSQKDVNSYQENIDYFKDNLEETRALADELGNKKTPVKPLVTTETTEEDDSEIIAGSIVNYKAKDGTTRKGIVESIDYKTIDSEGKDQVPSGENIDNIITVVDFETKEISHLSGASVTPISKEEKVEIDEGVAEDDTDDLDEVIPPERDFTALNRKQENKRKTNTPDRGLIEFLSYTHYDDNGKLVSRDKALDEFISNPENQKHLATAVAEYSLELGNAKFNEILEAVRKEKGLNKSIPEHLLDALEEYKKSKKLDPKDLKSLLSYEKFVGNVAIKVKLHIGGKIFSNKTYLPTLESNRHTVKSHAEHNVYVGLRQTIVKHLLEGGTAYTTGFSTNRGNPLNIDNTNSPNLPVNRKRNVATTLGIKPSEVELHILKSSTKFAKAKGYESPVLHKSDDSVEAVEFDFSSVGSVFAITKKTANGKPFAIKLNKSFISKEHAAIIFNAFSTLAKSELSGSKIRPHEKGSRRDKFPGFYKLAVDPTLKPSDENGVVWNLSAGELLDLLVVHGAELTDPNSARYKYVNKVKSMSEEHRLQLSRKRLFLERGYDENGKANAIYLCFGLSTAEKDGKEVVVQTNVTTSVKGKLRTIDYNRINLTSPVNTEEEKIYFSQMQNFIKWLTTYKTYAVHLSNKMLGLKLNGTFLQGRSFRIGKKDFKVNPADLKGKKYSYTTKEELVRKPGESYVEFLINNGLVTTDIEPNAQGRLFTTPFLHLGFNQNPKDNYGIHTQRPELKEGEVEAEEPVKDSEKPIVQTKKRGKPKKGQSLKDILNDDFTNLRERKQSIRKPYEKQDFLKELAWIRKRINIDDDEINVEEKLANMVLKGRKAWAIYSHSSITLYEAAETGTLYHEAFHRVSLGYFTKEEREAFYRSARLLYSMPKDKYSDKEVEEKLAEEFREFVIAKEKIAQPLSIRRIFKQILDFIRAIFIGTTGKRLSHHDIERLFNQIYSGRYRFSKVRTENLGMEPRTREIMGQQFDSVATYKDVGDITKYLAKKLLQNERDLNNIKKIKWNDFITRLENTITKLEGFIKTSENESEIETATKTLTLLKDVLGEKNEQKEYPKFVPWKHYINRFLRGIGIVHRESEIEDDSIYDRDDFYSDISEDEKSHKANMNDNADYLKPLKNNALADVKLVVSTLHSSEDVNESLGLVGFADGNKVWAKLLDDITSYDDVYEMIDKIRELGQEQGYYPYVELADILDESSEDFKTKFQTAFEAHKHDFIRAIFSEERQEKQLVGVNITFDSASHSNLARSIILKWNEFIMYDSKIITQEEVVEGTAKYKQKVVNDVFFEELLDKYNSRVVDFYNTTSSNGKKLLSETDLEKLFATIATILSEMHIDVSPSVIRRYAYKINTTRDLQENLYKLVDNIQGIIGPDVISDGDSLKNIIKNDVVSALGRAYADVNTHEEGGMVLGPDGASFYKYAKLNLVTDNLRRIKRSSKWAEDKVQLVGNKHSRLLNSLVAQDDTAEEIVRAKQARDNFGISTLSTFKSSATKDGGREYLKINPIEDYLFKAYAILNGKMLPFPILANRQTYYLMKGVPVIGIEDEKGVTDNVITHSNADGTVQFTDEVIDLFYGYYLDEKERIVKARKELKEYKEAKEEIKKSGLDAVTISRKIKELDNNLIRDYHYAGNFNFDKGNAYHFIHFKGYEKYKTADQVRAALNQTLNDRLQDDIRFCSEQQIVSTSIGEGGELNFYSKLFHSSTIDAHKDLDKLQNYAVLSVLSKVLINNQMAVIESEKMFLGDPALFKRNDPKDPGNLDTYEQIYKRWFGAGSTGTRLRSKYKGRGTTYNVSILNTQKFESSYYDMFERKHTSLFEEMLTNRLSADDRKDPVKIAAIKKEAKLLAQGNLKKYKNVDPTDGTAFISPEMFKEITERLTGWGKDKQRAFDLLQSDKTLSAEEVLEAELVVFSPLKTMYMGNHNFNNIDLLIYNKMAMFTLFRQHVKGTHLEDVLDRMETKGNYADKNLQKIHVFNFDSAIKVGGLNGMDLFKNKQTRSEVNDMSDAFVFEQSFDYLKHQQVVDPHDAYKQNFGTAGVKITMADIDKSGKYGKFGTGQDLLEAICEARNAISDFGIHKVNAKFGIYKGKVSNKKLMDMLQQDAISANKSYDFVEALRTDPDTGEKYLELDAFNDRKWVYARIKTIVDENTVDLTTPGNQLVQMTDFGMGKVGVKRDLQFIRYNEEGKRVEEMECRVSSRLFKQFFPRDHKITKEDLNDLLKSNPHIFGYRIPTQGQNSVVKLKVVELLPEQSGDIIQLPLEFTAVTGSDFDIDKLFVAVPNYEQVYENNKFIGLKKIEFKDDSNSTVQQRYHDRLLELFNVYKYSPEVFGSIPEAFGKKKEFLSKYFKDYASETSRLRDKLNKAYDEEDDNNLSNVLLQMDLEETIKVIDEDLNTLRDFLVAAKLMPTLESFTELPMASQNTSKANQNRVLDAIFTVLTDEKHFLNVTTPLGAVTDILENKSDFYEAAYSKQSLNNVPALYTTTPSFQSGIKTKFSSSTFGIAPYSLSNNHHSLTQMADITMSSNLNFGWNEKKELPLNRIVGEDNKYISSWISGLIDIHVDGVNKPIAAPLNINEATHDIVNFLIRIGVGEDTFDFVAQPILQDYAFSFFKSQPKGSKKRKYISSVDAKDIIKYTYDLYKDLAVSDGLFSEEDLNQDSFAKSYLIPLEELLDHKQLQADATAYLETSKRDKDWYIRQLSILVHFSYIKQDAELLRNFVLACRVDTKKYGSNPIEIMHFIKSIENIMGTVANPGRFKNIERMLTVDPNYEYQQGDTFLPTLIKNSMFKIYDILKEESIYSAPGFHAILEELLNSTAHGDYNRMGILKMLMDETVTYFMGQFFADKELGFGMDYTKLRDLVFDLGSNSNFKTLVELKSGTHKLSKLVSENSFLNSIVVDFSDNLIKDKEGNGIIYSHIKPLFKSLRDGMEVDEVKNDFKELLYSEHKELRDLATFLYIYGFYTSAFKNKAFSYASWLPVDMNRELEYDGKLRSFNAYIKDVVEKLNSPAGHIEFLQDIKRDVFTNMWDTPEMVLGFEDNEISSTFSDKEKGVEDYAIKVKFTKELSGLFMGKNSLKQNIYKPYVAFNDNLYEYVGYDKSDNEPYYIIVPRKGFGNKGLMLHEYGIKTKGGHLRSILSVNNPHTANITIDGYIKMMKGLMSEEEKSNFVSVPLDNQIVVGIRPSLFTEQGNEGDIDELRKAEFDEMEEREAAIKGTVLYDLRGDENDAALENINLKSSTNNKTSVNNPIHIDIDGSSLLHQEGRPLGAAAYAKFGNKEYSIVRNNEHIRNFLGKLAEQKGVTVPDNISNPTAELYSLVVTLQAFRDTSEHLYIHNDNELVMLLFKGTYLTNLKDKQPKGARAPIINALYELAKKYAKQIVDNGGSVRMQWVPTKTTEGNKKVDKLAKSQGENKNDFVDEQWGKPVVIGVSTPTNTKETINIYAGTNENADLSNFAHRPFDMPYGRVNNIETAFQLAKIGFASSSPINDELITKLMQGVTGSQAKALGRQVVNLNTKLWDSESSRIMKELLLESFKQNPKAAKRLLDTGAAKLTHTQDRSKWGKEFPKLLMEVREELRTKSNSPNVTASDTKEGKNNVKEC